MCVQETEKSRNNFSPPNCGCRVWFDIKIDTLNMYALTVMQSVVD